MTQEVLQVEDRFYILATSGRVDDRTRVLKQGDTFAILNRFGDMDALVTGEFGLYHRDTRYLSELVLRVGGRRPLLLGSMIQDDNALLAVDLMNPDLRDEVDAFLPRGLVHLFRAVVLWQGTYHERVRIHNYGRQGARLKLSLTFGSDFADIFEVRGTARARRGRHLAVQLEHNEVVLGYEGLDGCVRRTRIRFDPPPMRLTEREAEFAMELAPRGEATFRWSILCEQGEAPAPARVGMRYEEASRALAGALRAARAPEPQIYTSNEQFNGWLNRSVADLHMMRTETAHGPYPYAGVPWYNAVFGRDGLITALECLWYSPELARGVLRHLAATQACDEDPARDAEPGKIVHEMRNGEMAATGEVPFGRYYGTVDATPLFVMLADAYVTGSGDVGLARALWPNIERALTWMDRWGDRDGDGFIEYARRSERGLAHQGWKDSQDAVFHEDGSDATGPIALCEVQGYAYAARVGGARLARLLGLDARARELAEQAERLRQRFEEAFWCEELSTYALALDGQKRPCRVRASNAGHCLYTGIADPARAARVAELLTSEAFFSGWGVRTVAASERRYNPMSYHNGSVWPHDNALLAAGCARYGLREATMRILTGLFDTSLFCDLYRLPELFCGFRRRPGSCPTMYPVSCAPQAWAAGSVLQLLQACLGLEIRALEQTVAFRNPMLPPFLQEVRMTGLRVGPARVDLVLTRHEQDVGLNVVRRQGDVTVVVVK